MPRIHFRLSDGAVRTVEARPGQTIMNASVSNSLPGILAECGGFLNCGTCHVYVDEAWLERLPPVSTHEDEMLDAAAAERKPNSRLSCQLAMTDDLDGVPVAMPECQT